MTEVANQPAAGKAVLVRVAGAYALSARMRHLPAHTDVPARPRPERGQVAVKAFDPQRAGGKDNE